MLNWATAWRIVHGGSQDAGVVIGHTGPAIVDPATSSAECGGQHVRGRQGCKPREIEMLKEKLLIQYYSGDYIEARGPEKWDELLGL